MKYKSALTTQASGSIDGLTASHNRGGRYFRARAIPTDPATAFQIVMRNALATFSQRWANVLTPAERAAWDLYGVNVPVVDVQGDPINLTGQQWYIGSNSPRQQADIANLGIIDAGPTNFTRAGLTQPSIGNISAGGNSLDLTFDLTDPWLDQDAGGLIIRISRPQNASVNFFKGPYRFAGIVNGNLATPPTSPQSITLPFPVAAGQNLFAELRSVEEDGRSSATFPVDGVVIA